MARRIYIPGKGEFPSYAAAGRSLGVTHQAIRDAEKKNRLEEIGKSSKYAYEHNGVVYSSMNEASKKLGVPYTVLWEEQCKKNGGPTRKPSRSTLIDVLGRTFLSVSALARHLGVKYHYVRSAWKQHKLKHYLEKPVVFEGKEYLSIHEAAKVNNKNWYYIEKRVA